MNNAEALNIIRTYIHKKVGSFDDKTKGYYYTQLWRVVNQPVFSAVPYVETEGSILIARAKIREALTILEKQTDHKDRDLGFLLNYTKSDSA